MGLTIVNIKEDRIDFKFKFVDKYNFEISQSDGYLSVPRNINGILVYFGLENDFEDRLKSDSVRLSFKNMNDILKMFKQVY